MPAHILSEFGLEEMVNKLQDKPDVLEQIFTAKNNYGQLPAHLYDDYKMEIMINALKDKPELLKEIFTTQDKLLNLPAHYFTNNREHKIMIQTLKNQPGVIPQIYTTQNYRWSLPVPNRSVRDIVLPCLAEQGEKDAARKIFTNINVNRASLGMKDLNPYFDLFKVDEKEIDDLVYKFSVLDDMKKSGRFFEIADEYGFLTDLQKNAIKNFEQEPVLFL